MDDLRTVLKIRWREILCTVINVFYLCAWVAAQAGAAYFIQKISIEEWLRWCFRIVFGLSTLAVVVIHIGEDVIRIWIRAKARVARERKEVYNSDNNKDKETEET